MAKNGGYLSAHNGGGYSVAPNRDAIGTWETFTLNFHGAGKVSIQASNGYYVSADQGGGGLADANRTARGDWETFTLHVLDGGRRFAFETHYGYFLTTEADGSARLHARSTALAANTKFERVDMEGALVSLIADTGKYVCVMNGGGGSVLATATRLRDWETLRQIRLPDGSYGFRTHTGHFLSCAGGMLLYASADKLGANERFTMRIEPGGGISLKAVNGLYVCADHDRMDEMVTTRAEVREWETFTLFIVKESRVVGWEQYGKDSPDMPAVMTVHKASTSCDMWWSGLTSSSSAWSQSKKLPFDQTAPSAPALGILNGTLYCAHQGNGDNGLYFSRFDPRTSTWTADRCFARDNQTLAEPALINYDGRLLCVHRGNRDSFLWWCELDPVSQRWSEDIGFPNDNQSSAGPALAVFEGILYCVHRGNKDSDLWWCRFDPKSRTWTEDHRFTQGNRTASAPALAVYKGRLICVHKGDNDPYLWWCTFDPTTQTFSEDHPFTENNQTAVAPALFILEGRLYCIHRGNNDDGFWWAQFDSDNNSWSADSRVNNEFATSSRPTVIACSDVYWPPLAPSDRWMTELLPFIKDKKLSELCIPGSHDAGVYMFEIDYLDAYSDLGLQQVYEVAQHASEHGISIGSMTAKMIHDTVADWGLTQGHSIADQLKSGIRYFDLRVMLYQGEYRVFHGFVGVKLSTIFSELKDFLTGDRKELVFIKLSHFKNMRTDFTAAERQTLADYVQAQLGALMLDSLGRLQTDAFGSLTQQGSRLVAFFEDRPETATRLGNEGDYYSNLSEIPPSGTPDEDVLYADSVAALSRDYAGKLTKISWCLTPGTDEIVKGIVAHISPAIYAPRNLRWLNSQCAEMLTSFVNAHPTAPINLILVDFADESGVQQIALSRNITDLRAHRIL